MIFCLVAKRTVIHVHCVNVDFKPSTLCAVRMQHGMIVCIKLPLSVNKQPYKVDVAMITILSNGSPHSSHDILSLSQFENWMRNLSKPVRISNLSEYESYSLKIMCMLVKSKHCSERACTCKYTSAVARKYSQKGLSCH